MSDIEQQQLRMYPDPEEIRARIERRLSPDKFRPNELARLSKSDKLAYLHSISTLLTQAAHLRCAWITRELVLCPPEERDERLSYVLVKSEQLIECALLYGIGAGAELTEDEIENELGIGADLKKETFEMMAIRSPLERAYEAAEKFEAQMEDSSTNE